MITPLATCINRPLRLGGRSIANRVVLAPMTQLGHIALRQLVDEFGGCGLMFSEMCSAVRVPTENRYRSEYFRWRNAEQDGLVCQIVGMDPDRMAAAARRVEKEGFFGVDLNFSCAAAAICRHNGGAALLKDPRRAGAIVAAVRQAVSIPVTVKFRTGWCDDPGYAVELACRFEDAGADALTFHPRVAPDRRSRPAKWDYIRRVKQQVGIPVFGNGDVVDQQDCLKMLRITGCDGVALGRIAVARPWIFAEWTGALQPDPDIYRRSALKLARLLTRHYDPQSALRRFRKFAFYFSGNFKFGHTLYTRILNAAGMAAVEIAVNQFFARGVQVMSRPNMNFFS